MAGIRSKATVTGSLPLEAALVRNADGTAIASPVYYDCTYNASAQVWVCDTPAPNGTYAAGAQLMRLKGSSPAVTAGSISSAIVGDGTGTGTGATELAAPTDLVATAITANSLTLQATKDPNAAGLRYQLATNAAFTVGLQTSATQAGAYTYSGLIAGSPYYTRVLNVGTGNYSNSDYSATLQVSTQASGTAILFTPQSSEFRYNKRNDTVSAGAGYVYRDALAAWPLQTTATSLLIRGKTNFPAQYLSGAGFSVFVNGSPFSFLTFTQAGAEQEFSVTGLPAGDKLVEIYENGPGRAGEQGDIIVINLTGVTVPAGFTASVATPPKAAIGIVAMTNSRGVGGGVIDGARYAWTRQLGRAMGADVYLIGYSSLQMGAHSNTATLRQQQANEVKARLTGYATTYYIYADEENDHAYNTFSPAQLQSYNQAFIPLLQSTVPSTKLVFQNILPDRDGNMNVNGQGFTHADYNAALIQAVTGQPTAYFVDITQAGAGAADYADAVHLAASGENKVTAFYLSKLPNLSSADQPSVPSGPSYHAVDAQNFDSSLSLPANYSTRAGHAVVQSNFALTAPNVVEITAIHDTGGVGPTQTLVDGRFTAAARVVPATGTAYWGVRFAQQPDGSCYFVSAATNAGSTTAFYVFCNRAGVEGDPLRVSQNLTNVINFYQLTVGRVGARVVVRVKRTADSFYLNDQGVFTSVVADFYNVDDANPLPAVAGPSSFYCYLESNAPGQALFDSAVLESYS